MFEISIIEFETFEIKISFCAFFAKACEELKTKTIKNIAKKYLNNFIINPFQNLIIYTTNLATKMSFLFRPVFGAKITLSLEIKDVFDSFLSSFFSSEVFKFSCFFSLSK